MSRQCLEGVSWGTVLFVILGVAGCCGAFDDSEHPSADPMGGAKPGKGNNNAGPGKVPTSPAQPTAQTKSATKATKPNFKDLSCKAADGQTGTWRPSRDEVLGAVRQVTGAKCIDAAGRENAVSWCMDQSGTTTPEVGGGNGKYSACNFSVHAFSWQNRHWVKVNAFLGEGATFWGETFIYEIVGGQARHYVTGFVGTMPHCDGGPAGSGGQDSPAMKADWPSMPGDVRKFFCE